MAEPATVSGGGLQAYSREWSPPDGLTKLPSGWKFKGYFEQNSPNGLEVVVFDSGGRKPTLESLRTVHSAQQDSRATPLLVVTFFQPSGSGETQAKACGPEGVQAKIWEIYSEEAFEKAAGKALATPNPNDARRYLKVALPRLGTEMPGVHNAGLFATHQLQYGLPAGQNWNDANAQTESLLDKRGQDLIEALGFTVAPIDGNLLLLKVGEHQKAIAVFLRNDENYEMVESVHSRFDRSPVSDALLAADNHNIQWVIISRSSELRLYATKTDIGIGGGSRTEKFLELDLDLLTDGDSGYLSLVFSSEAMKEGGSLAELVTNSSRFASELASRLRDRVYDETIPILGKAIAEKISTDPSEEDLVQAYQQAMLVLFRLLFLAYGEARKLLPIDNEEYSDHSLSKIAQRILKRVI